MRTSTPNTNTLGWKVWTSYTPTWFHLTFDLVPSTLWWHLRLQWPRNFWKPKIMCSNIFHLHLHSRFWPKIGAWEWDVVLLCNTFERSARTGFSHVKRYNHSNLREQKRLKRQTRTFTKKPMKAKWIISPSNYHLSPQIVWPKCCSGKRNLFETMLIRNVEETYIMAWVTSMMIGLK